jgi:AraC family transcriptional regulator
MFSDPKKSSENPRVLLATASGAAVRDVPYRCPSRVGSWSFAGKIRLFDRYNDLLDGCCLRRPRVDSCDLIVQTASKTKGDFEMPSKLENRADPGRIRVRRGDEYVELAPWVPSLSSARSPWEGVLLERHIHGPHSADRHQHLSHFICLLLSGPVPISWQSQGKQGRNTIGPGSVLLVSRGTEDSIVFLSAVRRILLNLEPSLLKRAFPEIDTGRDVEFIDQWGVFDPQIDFILRALEADLEAGIPAGGLFGESLLCALAVHLQNRYAVTRPAILQMRNGLPRARLNRVIEFIEANLHREIALSALAETAGMSPHYFSELFKQSVHLSPYQYVLRRRIDRARTLLNNPEMTVFEASIRSGFANHSHFTKVFRRVVGVTPTAYRAAL